MSDVQIAISPLEAIAGKKVFLVVITGQLDETNVDAQSKSLYELLEKEGAGVSLVFDLAGLTYMNSKSIGYLTDWYTKVNDAGGRLVICAAQENVLDVLTVVGITNLVQHYPNVDEAKKALAVS